ncbi:MAG: hypothetical protein GAK28_00404 [Luteibacter sp.]|uniref:hypothetical protein n=1 Tax=Luteibacter sp. TaxID=1886636 RepID=UPI00137CCE84|nr:hypothetical protein [Luteibacter sp.]KAF1009759.1 MAG: hypothetical protein GAK28_00404 [Luteibacter sp.]
MSHVGRMYFRMCLPSALALATGAVTALAAHAAQEWPGDFGITSLYSQLPRWLFAGGVTLAAALAAMQAMRVRQWERGAVAACYVCGCVLGAARPTREGLGKTRRCLGCGRVHGVNHRLSPHLRPLAVAVADTAKAPVRSVRSLP